jgi:hypothetical protein
MTQELAGQRALVTAGAAGIGRVIARRFAAAGARGFVCDVDDAALAAFRAEPHISRLIADRALFLAESQWCFVEEQMDG